jgi:hypothetical protein
MWIYALIPFALQGLAISVDEVHFHYKRGLPRWERIGHPLDTLSQLFCLAILLFAPAVPMTAKIYGVCALISCIMITKDEFVHKEFCCGAENWLHAVLFILHPISLATAGLIWMRINNLELPSWILNWLDDPVILQKTFYGYVGAIFFFFIYQIIFWNFLWKPSPTHKQ